MSTLLHLNDRELRAPETEILPDGRKRLTRFLSVPGKLAIPPELSFAYGSADLFGNAPTGWTGLRLTNKKLTDDVPMPGRDSRPVLQLVYEQIDASAETPVGADDVSYDESGFKTVVADFVQFTTGGYVPGTVGTTTYSGDASCVLKTVEDDDDGTVRRIKRTFINGGTLSDETQTKNNGSLLLRIIKALTVAPATPSGFVLIDAATQNPNGLPLFVYTFAQGQGLTARSMTLDKNAAGLPQPFDFSSVELGSYPGILTETIQYLTPSSVTENPTTSILPGGNIASVGFEDVDGYRIWSVVYRQGLGTVEIDTETKNNGKLIIYRRLGLGGSPIVPSPTIGGTVVEISATNHYEAGVQVFDYRWAEGEGEISRGTEYRLSNDGGATGMTVTTVRYLTASSVSSNPITPPGGFATVQNVHEDVDGYRIWTGIYAIGTGTVISSNEVKNNGKLVIYNRVALDTAPTAPTATIGGTVVAIRTENRRDRFHEGIVVYDYAWAEGEGVVGKSTREVPGGLREETWISLGTTYDASFMLPSGVLLEKNSEDLDGVTRWTVACMQRSDGTAVVGPRGVLTGITVTNTGGSYTSDPTVTIAAPPAGGTQATAHSVRTGSGVSSVVIDNPGLGYTSAPAIGFSGGGGTGAAATSTIDGTPTVALQYQGLVPFRYPGRAKQFSATVTVPVVGTATCHDVFLSPPVEAYVVGTHVVTYATDGNNPPLAFTLWNPTDFATIRASFVAWQAAPRSILKAFEGYASVSPGTVSGTTGGSGFDTCILGERVYASTGFSISLSGGPTIPDGATTYTLHALAEPAFVGFDGTQYYRKTIIYATPAAQAALPV